MNDRQLVTRHVHTLLEEADDHRIPRDSIGRLLLEAAVEIWRADRSIDDIEAELEFMAENLDPGQDYAFIRP